MWEAAFATDELMQTADRQDGRGERLRVYEKGGGRLERERGGLREKEKI